MAARLMEQHLCNLKLYTKELNAQAKRCNKEEAKEKVKCKRAIQNNTLEKARIHSENAIRQKNQGLNFLRLSSRVDAVASQIQSSLATRKITCSIGGVCTVMEHAMKTLNLEMIAGCLDKFESQLETFDVQSSFTENVMSQSTTTSVPLNDVNQLLQSVADEAGLDLRLEFPRGTSDPNPTTATESLIAQSEQDDELTARLARLRMN